MSALLETKFHVPPRRRDLVGRPRLVERLDLGIESRLTLVSAPAGFGKSTLLAEWLATGSVDGRSAAWLSLDRRDNDPALFWAYAVTALARAAGGVGGRALAILEAAAPPVEAVLTALLNDIDQISNDVVLVLDDFHVIDAREVQDQVAFLLDHAPPQLHLVIAGRADPALPLARLRARGELVEVRAADLRFSPEEAAAYLNGVMGLQLSGQDVSTLEGRTEGWVAALQLAALSMRGRDDVAGFIAAFAGDDRYIVDYLVTEVLQRQPDHVRHFLLRTSILGRLTGPLCDAVTGQDGGRAMLEALERQNLFVVPLDDRRTWYRYHHLFADVLHARLLAEQPDRVPELHRRASTWNERNGDWSVAIDHALAAGDLERVAELVERAMPDTRRERREATLRGWLELIPDEVLRAHPVLSNGYAGALLATGAVAGVEERLRDAERWLDGTGDRRGVPESRSAAMVVVDEREYVRLPGAVAVHRAGLALLRGDASATVASARRAVELLPADDHVGHGAAAALLGLASWAQGDLDAAHEGYADCSASLLRAGYLSDVLGCAITLADIRIVQGRLGDAMRTYEVALRLTSRSGGTVLRGTADMHVGMSQVAHERNDIDAATRHLARSRELGEHLGLPQNPHRRRIAAARIRLADGDLEGALDLLEEAERLYVGDFTPDVRPVAASTARVWIAHGKPERALGWARDRGLSFEDDLSYLREFEHVTLAGALVAGQPKGSLLDGLELLGRLRQAAEAGGRLGSLLEILVLQAVAEQRRHNVGAALAALEHALGLAEPEGYIRTFLDQGPPMKTLLESAAQRGIARTHVRRLLTAFDTTYCAEPVGQRLIEPLSAREREVLRLLASELSGPEIARELVVSLNTVRTHTTNIYAKLAVNNRRAAVRRAQDLDLLQRQRNQRP